MSIDYIPFKTVLSTIISSCKKSKFHHIYEVIDKNNNNSKEQDCLLISDKWSNYFINYLGQLSSIGSGVPPQLPPRNKLNNNMSSTSWYANNIEQGIDSFDYFKNKINCIELQYQFPTTKHSKQSWYKK